MVAVRGCSLYETAKKFKGRGVSIGWLHKFMKKLNDRLGVDPNQKAPSKSDMRRLIGLLKHKEYLK